LIKILSVSAVIAAAGMVLAGCPLETGTGGTAVFDVPVTPEITGTSAVNTGTLFIKGLKNSTVYLVKVNPSGSAVTANSSGSVLSVSGNSLPGVESTEAGVSRSVSGVFAGEDGVTVSRTDYSPAQEFNRNPPQAAKTALQANKSFFAAGALSMRSYSPPAGGFWVQKANGVWEQRRATLAAASSGGRAKVWVDAARLNDSSSAANDNSITRAQARTLANKFDTIYEKETALFGYEYGGGPGGDGGADGDTAIQIFVYDIYEDYNPQQSGGVLGYFWGKDLYSQSALGSSYKTNVAEMFYLDAYFTDKYPDIIYSTLVHEFQHMINFNEKSVKRALGSETWFDEMLSMLAEDVIDGFIGISTGSSGHPAQQRMPYFLANYNGNGLTLWPSVNAAAAAYPKSYAFGAYLARNYGGAELIHSIMTNNYGNERAIDAALGGDGVSLEKFKAALRKYGEAIVFNNTDNSHNSFNRTVTGTVSGISYTFTGFDIRQMRNSSGSAGPVINDAGTNVAMGPYSIVVQSKPGWKNITGSFSLLWEKPSGSPVEAYLLATP